MNEQNNKQIIGKAEAVGFPELGVEETHARIDTGAKTSAIWASSVSETEQGLEVVFFGPGSECFTGQAITFKTYSETVVASSNGAVERRYKVRLLLVIAGRRIRAWFTLADRASQVYPILVGRNVLRGKFLVDVAVGSEVLRHREKMRSSALKKKTRK